MKTTSRQTILSFAALLGGAITCFYFFALSFNGAPLSAFIGPAIALAAISAILHMFSRPAERNTLAKALMLPALGLALFGFFGALSEFDRIGHYLFWPVFVSIYYFIIKLSACVLGILRENQNKD